MARTATADTIASDIYTKIRAEILTGSLVPGQHLKPGELRIRFGVSVSVVREALSRLAEHRLVLAEHNQGFRVADLDAKDLKDLTAVRVQVETFALRESIRLGDYDWESRVVATHHVLVRTPTRTEKDSEHTAEPWADAHRAFHRALIDASDNAVLLDICHSLFDASELYRRLSAPLTTANRDLAREHLEIMEAAMARDADLAAARLASHFELTTSLLLSRDEFKQ